MHSREYGQRNEECEEDVEALVEAAGEDAPVGDGVDDGAVALLGQRRVVPVLVVAEETLEKERQFL